METCGQVQTRAIRMQICIFRGRKGQTGVMGIGKGERGNLQHREQTSVEQRVWGVIVGAFLTIWWCIFHHLSCLVGNTYILHSETVCDTAARSILTVYYLHFYEAVNGNSIANTRTICFKVDYRAYV